MKVIALTIEKAVNRCWFYLGGMIKSGVPEEMIAFYRGRTAVEFGEDYDLIAAAAEADGFPFVRYFQGYGDLGIIKQDPAQMCQVWSYADILRTIAEGDENVLVTWDDRILTVPYFFLCDIVNSLEKLEQPFYFFQLRLRGEIDYLRLPEIPLEIGDYMAFFRAITDPTFAPDYVSMLVQRGFFGYDESIIFSPAGAAWMLQKMREMEAVEDDIKKIRYMDVPLNQKPYYCSNINIDNWICWGLRQETDKAAKDFGIYCPRYQGYDFISDPVPMGSYTNWATERIPHFKDIVQKTKLRYIN